MQVMEHMKIRELRCAISYYCNLRCQHCYVPELNRVEYKDLLESSQLSVEQITGFLDQLHDEMGLESISITGGEALLRIVWPRTRQVMHHALERGIKVRLITSGSGQIPVSEVVEAAGGLPGLQLQVSLDGLDEVKVDEFRGHKGAQKKAMATIQDAVALGIPVRARYTATAANHQEVVATYDRVSELGADEFVVKPMFAAGTARENQDLSIQQEAVAAFQQALVNRSVDRATRVMLPQPCFIRFEDMPAGANAEIMYCGCGKDVAYLSTNGDVYPCTYMIGAPGAEQFRLGNVGDPHFNFAKHWGLSSTYTVFRDADLECNCTAQNLLDDAMCAEGAE